MKIILALLIFSAVVLFHELGHFLFAKLNKVEVLEFSLGMGPRLVSKTWKGTKYSIKLLPLGGSCMMKGEDADQFEKGTFNSASVWGRFSIIAAGPIFNFILALIFSTIIVGSMGYDPAEVMSVMEDSAAAEAGLQEGDIITRYQGHKIELGREVYLYQILEDLKVGDPMKLEVLRNGEKIQIGYVPDEYVRYLMGITFVTGSLEIASVEEGMPISYTSIMPGDTLTSINGHYFKTLEEYSEYVSEHPLTGDAVTITWDHSGLEYKDTVTPEKKSQPITGFSYNIGSEKVSGLKILKYSWIEVKFNIKSTLLSLKGLLTGRFGVQDLSGPVGVVDVIGETYEQAKSEGAWMVFINMVNMVVLLSANLGVMNLLPIPALDGGRLVFIIIEIIKGKRVNPNTEGTIHFVGMMMLLLLMAVVMYQDVMKLF